MHSDIVCAGSLCERIRDQGQCRASACAMAHARARLTATAQPASSVKGPWQANSDSDDRESDNEDSDDRESDNESSDEDSSGRGSTHDRAQQKSSASASGTMPLEAYATPLA